jgi:hypothetical protein
VRNQLEKSFSGASQVAERYPRYAEEITHAARGSFLSGSDWAYAAGILSILLGASLVFFLFPGRDREKELLAGYAAEDSGKRTRPRSR